MLSFYSPMGKNKQMTQFSGTGGYFSEIVVQVFLCNIVFKSHFLWISQYMRVFKMDLNYNI